jgi:ankyrin repeat protein
MTAVLLRKGVIDVNSVDENGETALHRAVVEDNLAVVGLLLAEPGIEVSVRTEHGGTPLHYALAWKREGLAQRLIAFKGCDVNARSQNWPAPIGLAIRENLAECVEALCARPDIDLGGVAGSRMRGRRLRLQLSMETKR